jgi:flagellar hook-basal body complex protein FliE
MINVNANISSLLPKVNPNLGSTAQQKLGATNQNHDFADTAKVIEKYISKVDDLQQTSDMSIKDLLAGKNEDITTVVAAVAKADMSFKLLVGVRNKLIEAYKQTMNMPL